MSTKKCNIKKSRKKLKGGASGMMSRSKKNKVKEGELDYIEKMKKISLIDFMLGLIQELITFTIEGDSSIYGYMIDYINKKNLILEDNTRLVVISVEIGEDFTFDEFDIILDNEIEKHRDEVTVRLIYYRTPSEMGTHFMVKEKTTQQKRDSVVSDSFDQAFCDPYKKWQKPGTHGYCQMYSLFCAMSNHIKLRDDFLDIITPDDFIEVDPKSSVDYESDLAKNNHLCTKKTLDLINYMCIDESYPELTTEILRLVGYVKD